MSRKVSGGESDSALCVKASLNLVPKDSVY
jgi:hypothetical protein